MSEIKFSKVWSEKGGQILIKDAPSYWAKVQKPEQKYKADKGVMEYSLQLLVSEEVVDALEDKEINKKPSLVATKNKAATKNAKKAGKEPVLYPKEYEDHYLLTVASLAKWPDGNDKEIKVVKDGKPFKDLIGNGSIVDVIAVAGKDQGDGHPIYLSQVNIKELVEVDGGEASPQEFDFDSKEFDDDGFEDDDVAF